MMCVVDHQWSITDDWYFWYPFWIRFSIWWMPSYQIASHTLKWLLRPMQTLMLCLEANLFSTYMFADLMQSLATDSMQPLGMGRPHQRNLLHIARSSSLQNICKIHSMWLKGWNNRLNVLTSICTLIGLLHTAGLDIEAETCQWKTFTIMMGRKSAASHPSHPHLPLYHWAHCNG